MTRVSKDPEERKSEIIDAAEELFLTKGYDQTAVNDIVSKVGVAKGLFYYYFKTKDDILNAIAEKILSFMIRGMRKISEEENIDAITKIYRMTENTFELLGLKKKGMRNLANHVHKDKNSGIHRKIGTMAVEQLIPVVAGVVRQGVREGVFNTEYPEDVVSMILLWGIVMHEHIRFPVEDLEGCRVKAKAIEDMVERLLGARKGTFNFVQYVDWLNGD